LILLPPAVRSAAVCCAFPVSRLNGLYFDLAEAKMHPVDPVGATR
jgi:hypothetical protein